MDGRDPVVMQAIQTVLSRVPLDDWWAMPSQQRTQAIYEEIRRLDRVTIERQIARSERPVEKFVYSVV